MPEPTNSYPVDERHPEERRAYREDRPNTVEEPRFSIYKISKIINYIFGILASLIAIRLVLKLLGGNPGNPFAAFVYGLTQPLVSPFLTIFNRSFIDTGVGILELGTFIAILFYLFLNFLIVRFLRILATKNESDQDDLI